MTGPMKWKRPCAQCGSECVERFCSKTCEDAAGQEETRLEAEWDAMRATDDGGTP